jgi:hypothetical protein
MLHASTQKLIQKLYELTESGDIAWKESREGRCILDTEGYRVEINEEPPLLRLLGADGRELEKAEAADLSATPWATGEGTFASRVSDMSRRAQRVARGAEQAISKILSSLSAPPQKALEKAPEPEPIPAAIEFEPQLARKPGPVSAAESPASLAALGADLATQRRASPPQLPHSAPAAAPEPPAAALKADTAVSAALAMEASAPDVEPPVAAAEEELPLEDAPPPKPVAPAVTSFAGPPTPPPATVTPHLFVTGFSAASRPPTPAPQPAQPAPQPPPQAEPQKPPRTGADLYKPWS